MKWTQQELSHLVFLSDVVLNGKKKAVMPDMLQCLQYLAKSIHEVELPDSVAEQINGLMLHIEEQLRSENDRLREIGRNLGQPSQRKPFG